MEVQPLPRAFRELAPEIRENIYRYCFVESFCFVEEDEDEYYTHATPVFLVSLRGDPTLYYEALQYYYKHNTTVISPKNMECFMENINVATWSSIHHLYIDLPIYREIPVIEPTAQQWIEYAETEYNKLQLAVNLETLTVGLIVGDYNDRPITICPTLVRKCVRNSPILRRIEVELLFGHEISLDTIAKCIEDINEMFLHTKGKLVTVGGVWEQIEVWFWEEENGGVLQVASE